MAKKPTRTWAMVASLGIPLSIVGVSAMAISYATLIDVARVNGLPLPELFPILVDVGTVATMIAAAQFRLRGISGRWLAYTTFILLSGVSIVANATHAWRAADMTVTTPWASAILAATPPAALLAITHLVMMLIPDEKERSRLQTLKDKERDALAKESAPARQTAAVDQVRALDAGAELPKLAPQAPLRLVSPPAAASSPDQKVVRDLVLDYVQSEGKRPTGALIGEWLGGKSAKTGQRFLTKLEAEGAFETEPVHADLAEHAQISH